jgi:outer membrane protein assembly factor BamB
MEQLMNSVTCCGKLAKLVVGAALMIGCADWVHAGTGDWAQWRGPKRDNLSTETGLLKDWPAGGPALAWEIKGLGGGYSSVSIADGKIFTMGSFVNDPPKIKFEPQVDPKTGKPKRPPVDETTYVIALDLTGKILWKTPLGSTGGGGGYVGSRCTPTVDGALAYALSDNGELICVAVADGSMVWQTNLSKDLGGQMMSGWGYSESPTIDGDKLLVCPGGKGGTVAAFDKKTGKVLWRSKEFTDAASYASLVPTDIGGAHQYVVLTAAHVAGIGADGSLLWKADRKGQTAVIPTPIVKDNVVFVTSGYGVGCNAFKVEGSSTALKAEAVYDNKEMKVHHGGVILLGDHVFGASDPEILTCMSLKDGSVAWKERVAKGALAYADGRLYLRSERTGVVYLFEPSLEGYKEHGQLKQPDRSNKNAWAHPVIAGGKLYLRDQGVLLCYDITAK